MSSNTDDKSIDSIAPISHDEKEAYELQVLYIPQASPNLKGPGTDATKEFLKWAASGVVSKVAGTAIGGPILDLFGLGDKDYTKYLQQIQGQLADIRSELNQGMSQLQQGISEIKSAITAISVDTKDQKLQTALQMYVQNKNKINQNFMSFANAIAGVASTDKTTSERSIKTMYDLLQITNMNLVSEALLNIHDQVYGSGQLIGIIEYQVDVCYNAVTKWASDPMNLVTDGFNSRFVDYSNILYDACGVMCSELNNSVLPNLKAILAVELQGIALLAHAWSKTEQAPQLTVHINNVKAQITKIKGLYGMMTATAKYDKFVQDTVTAVAQPAPADVYDQFVEHLDTPTGNVGSGNLRYWRFAKPPFGKDWMAWGHPRHFVPPYRKSFHKPWEGEEPTMFEGSSQSCDRRCIIKWPINYGGSNQIIHLGTISGEKAPTHYYVSVKTITRNPYRVINDPRATPIPYPHFFVQEAPKEFAEFVKQLESPPA